MQYRDYDINQISIENLPTMLDYEIENLEKMSKLHTSLEYYQQRIIDGNLRGNDKLACLDICNQFNDEEISLEGYHAISQEFILTAVIAAIAVVVGMIIYGIWKTISVIKKIKATGMSPNDFEKIVNDLNIQQLDKSSVDKIIKTYNNSKGQLHNENINKLTAQTMKEMGINDAQLPVIFSDYKRLLGLCGVDTNKYTADDAIHWLNDVKNNGLMDAILYLAKDKEVQAAQNIQAYMRPVTLDLNLLFNNLNKSSISILEIHDKFTHITSGNEKDYRRLHNQYSEVTDQALRLSNTIKAYYSDEGKNDLKVISNLSLDMIKRANEAIAKGTANRLDKDIEGLIRFIGNTKDAKKAANEYIEPIATKLSEALGKEAPQDEVKRFARALPTLASSWVSTYAKYVRDEYRYMSFVQKYGKICASIIHAVS